MALHLLYTLVLAVIVWWMAKLWSQYKVVMNQPGIRNSLISALIDSSSALAFGSFYLWYNKRGWYASGWDISLATSLYPRVQRTWIVSDPALFKKITSSRAEFPKPTEQYVALRVFGRNILTEEGEEWKKYKRICAPAFSEPNNRLVWDYVIRIMTDFFEEVWLSHQTELDTEIIIEDFKIPCTQFALRIIVAAAFGQLLSWKSVDTSYVSFSSLNKSDSSLGAHTGPDASKSKLTIEQIFEIISEGFVLKLILPDWLFRNAESSLWPFGEKFRRQVINVREAYNDLQVYMKDIITTRQTGLSASGNSLVQTDSEKKADLFTNLLEANENDLGQPLADGSVWDSNVGEYVHVQRTADELRTIEAESSVQEAKLNTAELMGNIFIFLLAGHETTAHTIGYALTLLALYQDEQEKLFLHIMSVIPDGQLPRYEDLPLLTRSMAVMQEALRLFPPVIMIPKMSAQDTTFIVENRETDKESRLTVEKGDQIVLHSVGVHYNPHFWNDPSKFNPDRFMPESDWPRDAFVPFSAGARSCMGRRFAEVEGVAIITMLILKYQVKVKEEEQFKNETFEQRKERVLKLKHGLTLTFADTTPFGLY
ncbi:hypothetical protein D9758_006940 [Tetrapyrgos nigripes]|uniref:Cytochrome P450 n=1 Tax=Tetrapyrgos nigripes TaxID=182062 RepID=A0A8H5GSS3_9AGAR|nr:hypothetical protein D9758_006940 [Tetrapyrgos nigripes]